LNKIFKKITKKDKSNFKVEYRVSGEAFLTKPNKTTYMIQDVIKKLQKLNLNCLQQVELLMQDLLEKLLHV
jgi:hypothetical protein